MLTLWQLLINNNRKVFLTIVFKTLPTRYPKILVKDIKPKNNEYYIIEV